EHKDILYLGFSSGLSGTFNTVEHFLVDLQEQYPEQKIRAIDTLCASCGEGLIVDYAVKLRDEGKTIDEVYEYLQKFKFKICHEFLLDDLFYINRGGRLSFTSAIAGSILQIKPLLHVMNNGLPEITQKVRGRKAGLNALVDHLEKMMDPQECKMVYICHANCENDAKELAQLIKKRLRIKNCVIRYSDPIIGLHTGSGAIGIFFVGNAR
ncbi:MAG: DegV family protein, partial [Oscillospiraceae bacterium]